MLTEVPKEMHHLSEEEIERKKAMGSITTKTLSYLTRAFVDRGFNWLLPVVFSKVTDPLWPDPQASIGKRVEIEIYGKKVRAMQSMIVHKITACSLLYDRLFTLSPNIRLERAERASTGLHAYEFTQLDFEMRHASSRDVMDLVEELVCGLVSHIKREAKKELEALGRELTVPVRPFRVYEHEAPDENEFCWVVNIPRQFYDFEDFDTGFWDNYDLILPGFGEVLSGSRREHDYRKIVHKMERDGVRKDSYRALLELADSGRIKPTAGAGIGLERLIAWMCGAKHVCEVQPFPRVPGFVGEL